MASECEAAGSNGTCTFNLEIEAKLSSEEVLRIGILQQC